MADILNLENIISWYVYKCFNYLCKNHNKINNACNKQTIKLDKNGNCISQTDNTLLHKYVVCPMDSDECIHMSIDITSEGKCICGHFVK